MARKSVLMIAPYFVPRRRVGAHRPFKFACHLKDFGYEPVVLTIANTTGEPTENEKEKLGTISVIEIDTPFDRTIPPSSCKKTSESPSGVYAISDTITRCIDRNTPLDTWIYLFGIRYFSILKQVKEMDPDLIWATGDPWSGLWLGERLSRKLEKPFVADFRDPWTLANVPLRNRSGFSRFIDRKAERKIIRNADKLVYTSVSAMRQYTRHYPEAEEKAVTIYNAFDRASMEAKSQTEPVIELEEEKLNIVFFGRFRRLSPAGPVARALRLLGSKSPAVLEQIRIHSFGQPDREERERIEKLDLGHIFRIHQPVPPEKTLAVLNRCDLLLLSTHEKRNEIIPAKLWDYLAADPPILSIASNPEVGEIIGKSGAGIQLEPAGSERIAGILGSLVTVKKKRQPLSSFFSDMPNTGDRNAYEASRATGQLAEIFDELTTDG